MSFNPVFLNLCEAAAR